MWSIASGSGENPLPQRITVLQGETKISRDADVILTTILGSCIACCLFDKTAKIGGLNHFLLSQQPKHGVRDAAEAQRYGVYAMEVLVNSLLKSGASRENMTAHLYGGGNFHAGMRDIGAENAAIARDFLLSDGIRLAHEETGGHLARRLDFKAAAGQIRCRTVVPPPVLRSAKPTRIPGIAPGEIELF
jgi:chemotaxis protein CheD